MDLIGRRYEIKRQIGSGSLGDVFLARDRQEGINICLKLLRHADQTDRDQFKREFQLLTQLEHPNLIRVFDFGIDEKAGPFLTMEYAFGGDLGKAEALDPENFRQAALSMAAALDFIHTRGIIHGDLKPNNILIDSEGNYLLSDFGLSFARGKNERPQTSGSLAFVAPEVLRWQANSAASDIYSLGLVFYEMICGKPLFDGDASEIIGKKLSGQAPRIAIPPEYGGEKMAAIIAKMIEPDPVLRYQTAQALKDDLAPLWAEVEPIQAGAGSLLGKAPFVGRDDEMQWLQDASAKWIEGHNVTLYICGESGVGKSRLLDEYRIRNQTEGLRFYRVLCREDDLRPLSAIIMLLDRACAELDPHLEWVVDFGPDLKRLFPERFPSSETGPRDLTEADIKAGRRRLFDNLLRYLGGLSSKGKAIFAIEDIQWADNDTLELLKLAIVDRGTSPDSAMFLICTGQGGPDDEKASFLTTDAARFRSLCPPDDDIWRKFLAGFLGQEGLPDDLIEGLKQESGGNFLFAEEIVKELADLRLISRHRGQWIVDQDWAGKITVPENVREIIARRIQRLSPEPRVIAEYAAALGRSFSPDEILELAQLDNSIRYIFENLVRGGILVDVSSGMQERLDLAHGQLRRAIYDLIPLESRRRLHGRIAAYYQSREVGPEFLGHHFMQAGDFDSGYKYLRQSARNAERVYAYGKAADFYASAVICVESSKMITGKEKRLLDLYLGRGRALDFISPASAPDLLSKAVALAESADTDLTAMAEANIAAGNNCIHTGNNEKAVAYLQAASTAAQRAQDERLQGESCTALGFVYDKIGRLDDAEKSYLQALDHFAEIDYPEGSCRVLNYLGIIRKRRGDLDGAEDFYRRALEISNTRGFLWSAMNLYGNLGNLHSSRDNHAKALEYYMKSLEVSREISDRRIESINLLNIGHALNELGELKGAEKRFFEAIDKLVELGDRASEAITLNNLGLLYFKKCEIYNSIESYEKGLKIALEINQPRIELANRIGLAESFIAIADFEGASAIAVEAKELARKINDAEQLAAISAISAEIAFETGDMIKAGEFAQEVLAEQIGDPLSRAKCFAIVSARDSQGDSEREIALLLEKHPRISPAITRFRAIAALQDQMIWNPETWVARLNEAIRKSREYFLPSEAWRLSALKIQFLKILGEPHEASREEERLCGEVTNSLAGIDEKRTGGLLKFLKVLSDTRRMGVVEMDKVSREERLEVLIRVARTVNTIRELDPLLNKIMDLALETLNGERGFIMLYSDHGVAEAGEKALETVVARNLDREDILSETTISHSSALEVARSGRPLLLGRSDDSISARQSVVEFRISSILCAPLAVKGEVLGIVYVDSRSGVTFSQDDLDFLVSFADLAAIAIENARLAERLAKKNIYLQRQVESTWGFGNIIGRSPAMLKVFRMAESVAATDVTVVITGESGTGKELLARAMHISSPRKNGRFVPVDCGAVAESLLESELFGYIKGAFTGAASDREGLFEVAEGGTVFLDEISNTSKGFQAKLLRVLQENEIRRVGDNKTRKIDVRVIAATNKDLEQEVKSGNFREDLFYRINVIKISLPPLRDRHEDIPLLANYFLEKISVKMKAPIKIFSREALDALLTYSWPGNVRQLENICERVVIFSAASTISLDDLPAELKPMQRRIGRGRDIATVLKTKVELKAEKERIDRMFLMQLLEMTDGNVMEASRISGMDRSQIHHMMSRFRMKSVNFKKKD